MQRGSTGHMLFVIATGLVSLAACAAIGLLLTRFSHLVLSGAVTTILLACLLVWWGRQWWKDRKEKYQDYATENEIEYLEELADEHRRGVRDHSKGLRFLLPQFDLRAREPERYKRRIDNIRRIIETDPVKSKVEQAIKLKWKKTAEITEDGEGAEWTKRSVHFVRGEEEAVLWHKDATVTLVRLHVSRDFDDFIELEEFIAKHPREPDLDDATGEQKYLQEMDLFFVRHGYRDDLLHIQATDYAFLVAFGKLFKAGYAAGKASVVVAALVLHVIHFYEQDRERAIRWLTRTTEDFNRAQPPSD